MRGRWTTTPKRKSGSPPTRRRAGLLPRRSPEATPPPAPPVPEPPSPEPPAPSPGPERDLFNERRLRDSGGPEDTALYTCSCGMAWEEQVTASVRCPHCGAAQAW